eukprot:gene12942-15298_t
MARTIKRARMSTGGGASIKSKESVEEESVEVEESGVESEVESEVQSEEVKPAVQSEVESEVETVVVTSPPVKPLVAKIESSASHHHRRRPLPGSVAATTGRINTGAHTQCNTKKDEPLPAAVMPSRAALADNVVAQKWIASD